MAGAIDPTAGFIAANEPFGAETKARSLLSTCSSRAATSRAWNIYWSRRRRSAAALAASFSPTRPRAGLARVRCLTIEADPQAEGVYLHPGKIQMPTLMLYVSHV